MQRPDMGKAILGLAAVESSSFDLMPLRWCLPHSLVLHKTHTAFRLTHHHGPSAVFNTDCGQAKPSPCEAAEIKCVIVLQDTLIVY